jgi:hypothetical protein
VKVIAESLAGDTLDSSGSIPEGDKLDGSGSIPVGAMRFPLFTITSRRLCAQQVSCSVSSEGKGERSGRQNSQHMNFNPIRPIGLRQQITCFKVTAKSYNVATRTAEPRREKTARNSYAAKLATLYW